MFNVVFAVCYLNVGFSRLIASVGEERLRFSAIENKYCCCFSVRRRSSSFGSLGKAALSYCGTPWAFHITILFSASTHTFTEQQPTVSSGGLLLPDTRMDQRCQITDIYSSERKVIEKQ